MLRVNLANFLPDSRSKFNSMERDVTQCLRDKKEGK